MKDRDFIAELRGAASSLNSAAAAVQIGDLESAEKGVEDALYRAQSLLAGIRAAQAVSASQRNA